MNKPKMVIFDYGQTLVNETPFNPLEGTANSILGEMGRYGVEIEKQPFLEVHNHLFQNYLYEYFGIEFTKSTVEIERIFKNSACASKPTENIVKLLEFLGTQNIRTSVISNISFSGAFLKECIDSYIPSHKFEFIIASSEYVFRKPHKRIFELALRKAKLNASDAWYCGDNAVFDVDGAAGCGITPVWYKGAIEKSNKYIPKSERIEINDWNEMIDIIKAL
ncbi:MAG: HAD-superfamily hydrolase, subfamily variant 1 [Clostridiales bacterium]|nr:HAD-superfamily hydrolase, subfamily variant 1 [Clostridiales bacterium]